MPTVCLTTVSVPVVPLPGVIAVICITSPVVNPKVYGPVPETDAMMLQVLAEVETHTPLPTDSPVILATVIEVAAIATFPVIVVGVPAASPNMKLDSDTALS